MTRAVTRLSLQPFGRQLVSSPALVEVCLDLGRWVLAVLVLQCASWSVLVAAGRKMRPVLEWGLWIAGGGIPPLWVVFVLDSVVWDCLLVVAGSVPRRKCQPLVLVVAWCLRRASGWRRTS